MAQAASLSAKLLPALESLRHAPKLMPYEPGRLREPTCNCKGAINMDLPEGFLSRFSHSNTLSSGGEGRPRTPWRASFAPPSIA